MHRRRVLSRRQLSKCVKSAYPQPESQASGPRRASKMRPLHQKVRRKCDPAYRKCVCGCLTASIGEHFRVQKIAPLRLKCSQKCNPLSNMSVPTWQTWQPFTRNCVGNAYQKTTGHQAGESQNHSFFIRGIPLVWAQVFLLDSGRLASWRASASKVRPLSPKVKPRDPD